jgi:hypothetical protein
LGKVSQFFEILESTYRAHDPADHPKEAKKEPQYFVPLAKRAQYIGITKMVHQLA